MERIKPIDAYNRLVRERHREQPKKIVAFFGSKEEDYCKILAKKGFAVLVKRKHIPTKKQDYSYAVYEITHSPTVIETADYRMR